MPPSPTSWRSILILSSHLRLGLPSGSFPQVSPPKPCIHLSSPHTCYMPRPYHSSLFDHPNSIGWAIQIIKLLMKFSPLPCYLVPHRPKYSPQHPILKHPKPTFLPQCEGASFTPTENKRQNYSFVYINFCFDSKLEESSAPNDSKHSLTSICS